MVKIMQFDYDTGELIDTYKTLKDAADDNWISSATLCIKLKKGNGVARFSNRKLAFAKAYSPKALKPF